MRVSFAQLLQLLPICCQAVSSDTVCTVCTHLNWFAKSSVVSSSSQLSSHRCVLSPCVCVSSSPQSASHVSSSSPSSSSFAVHTLNREVLELVIFLKLRCDLRVHGSRLSVWCVVDDGFCGGCSSLCGAGHFGSMCVVIVTELRCQMFRTCWWLIVAARWRCCFTSYDAHQSRARGVTTAPCTLADLQKHY